MSQSQFLFVTAVFVLGLFMGTNLGVLLMCVMACARPSAGVEEVAE